jgi:broad specificity phosphatase PhoE
MQGRIKGSLDMPLCGEGLRQAESMAAELADTRVKCIYTAPCESARQTAECLAEGRGAKVRVVDCLRNVDHGLWHGKLIEEVKRNHPKVYRQGVESPVHVCPPRGETMKEAQARVAKFLQKVVRKNRDDMIAIIAPDPLALLIHGVLSGEAPQSDLWTCETDAAKWQLVEVELA